MDFMVFVVNVDIFFVFFENFWCIDILFICFDIYFCMFEKERERLGG